MNQAAILAKLEARVRNKGLNQVSYDTRIPRTHFYTIFSPKGNPTLHSLLKIAEAVGLEFHWKEKRCL